MARNEAKRQKKLMKKRQKDKARIHHLAEVVPYAMLSPKKKIQQARTYPLHECRINPNWQEKGLATVLVTRRQPDDFLAFGVYLVDTFCLGVKNTFCNADFTISRYETEVVPRAFESVGGSEFCESELACQVVYGAIAYAEQFGFKPNHDYKLSQYILDAPQEIGPSDIEFGKDGKPFFISGPNDNVDRIMHQLKSCAGEGNFDYLCQA